MKEEIKNTSGGWQSLIFFFIGSGLFAFGTSRLTEKMGLIIISIALFGTTWEIMRKIGYEILKLLEE